MNSPCTFPVTHLVRTSKVFRFGLLPLGFTFGLQETHRHLFAPLKRESIPKHSITHLPPLRETHCHQSLLVLSILGRDLMPDPWVLQAPEETSQTLQVVSLRSLLLALGERSSTTACLKKGPGTCSPFSNNLSHKTSTTLFQILDLLFSTLGVTMRCAILYCPLALWLSSGPTTSPFLQAC